MAYIINKYNGDQAAIVEDGTINTTLDLKLIGKNYAGYGEAQNENYTWLLENFASRTPPPKALIGQLWYDTSVQKLKINYDGAGHWHTMGVNDVVAAKSEASNLAIGDLFWVTSTEQLYCKGNTSDILIGGKIQDVITQMKATSVQDDVGNPHEIIQAVVNEVTTFIISSDPDFILDDTEALKSAGFTDIKQGITLNSLETTTNTSTGYQFWGTASDSDRLGGLQASDYINVNTPIFPNIASFSDSGFTVGISPNQRLKISNVSDIPTIENVSNDTIIFKTKDTIVKTPMKLVGQDIIPGNPDNSNIGSQDQKFNEVHASSFFGNASSADGLLYNGDFKSLHDGTPSVPANQSDEIKDTIVLRTNSTITYGGELCSPGSIQATYFIGIAFLGTGGDLAEKYLADTAYDFGTVLAIGGEKEVTAANDGDRAVGAVSTNPSYIMNVSLDGGVSVALKGRVPMKVIGAVKKGDRLLAANSGVARSLTVQDDSSLVFAVALEDNESTDVKLVEALIL